MNDGKIINITRKQNEEFKPTDLHHHILEILTEKIFTEGTMKYYGLAKKEPAPVKTKRRKRKKLPVNDNDIF